MQFFELTHPDYETDMESDDKNPVISAGIYQIPGISCDVCGARWSSCDRLRGDVPPDADYFAQIQFLPLAEWKTRRDGWARMLHVAPEQITPGVELGPPRGTCSAPVQEDVVHPMPGEIWVVARVRDAFITAGLTGVSFAAVQLSPDCGSPELWELVVHGRAFRQGSTEESLRLCDVCGRDGFPAPRCLAVDEARWNGEDFFFVDGNPNIILVTQRVADVLSAHKFTNVIAQPID